MGHYRRKTITILLSLLLLYAVIGLFALVQLQRKVALFGIGLGYYKENLLIIILSIFSLLKVIYELYRVEHPRMLSNRRSVKSFIS